MDLKQALNDLEQSKATVPRNLLLNPDCCLCFFFSDKKQRLLLLLCYVRKKQLNQIPVLLGLNCDYIEISVTSNYFELNTLYHFSYKEGL